MFFCAAETNPLILLSASRIGRQKTLGFTAGGRKKISEKDFSSDSNSNYSSAVQKVSFFIYLLLI